MIAVPVKMKMIAAAALSAAILSACGGGGGSTASFGSAPTTPTAPSNNNNGNTDTPAPTPDNGNQNGNTETPETPETPKNSDDLSLLEDLTPIALVHVDTPLSTHFITSADAQQDNPNVQLRRRANGELFQADNQQNTQKGLIDALDFNGNDEVKIKGIALTNATDDGKATEVNFTTPHSLIAKVHSKGASQSDVSEQTGARKGSNRAFGKATIDEEIVSLYKQRQDKQKTLQDERGSLIPLRSTESRALRNYRLAQQKVPEAQATLQRAEAEVAERRPAAESAARIEAAAIAALNNASEANREEARNQLAAATAARQSAQSRLEDAERRRGIEEQNKRNAEAELENTQGLWETAKKALDDQQTKVDEAQAEWTATDSRYQALRQLREQLTTNGQSLADSLTYIKPDADGLSLKEFDGVYVVQFADGTQVVIQDPAAAGWTYQTYASYVEPREGAAVLRGVQSLGQETKYAAIPTTGTASYNGISTAYVGAGDANDRQLTSNVKAVVDFGLKGVRFETSGSQFHTLQNGVRVSEAAADYDLKGTAKWSDSNLFTGKVSAGNGMSGNLNGKFYGGNVEEIGGAYGLSNADNTQHFIGGYGAKRK